MRRNPPLFRNTPARPLPPNLSTVLDLSPSAFTLGLGNMRRLLDAIGHPEKNFRSILVAGTNGKGSVTAYLAALFAANGQSVGLYQSPHVYHVSERIRISGTPVNVDEMERAAARIVPLRDSIPYSYFEALTAIAFLIFAERQVEWAVLETGLGGRFDATNIVDPVATVLTSIGLDHRRLLGDTEEEILREKMGITRTGVPLFVGDLGPHLEAIVTTQAKREQIPLVQIREIGAADVAALDWTGMKLWLRTEGRDYGNVQVPFYGVHQMANVLLAVGATEYLLGTVEHLDKAASLTSIPGRFEVHRVHSKHIVLDVAHNDAALLATTRTLTQLSPPHNNAMVFGMLKRKELHEFPRALPDCFRRVYLGDPVPDESLSPPGLLERIGLSTLRSREIDVIMVPPFATESALDRFLDGLLKDPFDTILITGSFRTVDVFGKQLMKRGD